MADMKTDRLPFRVVRGPELKVLSQDQTEGTVYFTTDTRKIYMDTATDRLSMGGSTGIYYANVDQPDEAEEFFFEFDDLEDDVIPNVKDLILNADGSFYKVEEIRNSSIKTSRLTLTGTGGPGGVVTTGKINFDITNVDGFKTIVAGRPFQIEFDFSAVDADGNSTGNGRYEIIVNGARRKTGSAKQGHNSIEVGDLFSVIGAYEVRVVCYGYTGGSAEVSKSRYIEINSTAFTVEWDHKISDVHKLSKDFTMEWTVSVESDRQISYIRIDDKYDKIVEDNDELTISSSELKELNINHGSHKFELWTEAYIGNDEEPISSDHIIKNVLFYNDTSVTDPGFIISYDYFENTVTQYDTIQIPVMVYHPNNVDTAEIQFKVNGSLKSTEKNCKNFEYRTVSYTPSEADFVQLQFSCGMTNVTFIVEVLPLALDIEEVDGYEFKFKATDFANDEEIRNWTFTDHNGDEQYIEFSPNFDWINGGLKTGADDVGPYFKIQAGSYINLPYKIFSEDLKNDGACFKMIFKASNCRDYDASVVECMTAETFQKPVYDEEGNATGEYEDVTLNVGLALNAQNSEIKSQSNSLVAQYCEDTYIEYEFDVCKYSDNIEDKYLTIWIDGIPAGVVQFSRADSFLQGTAKNLKIGSDDCDVYIYLIKFYRKHLTSDEHLANFIMDAPNSTEMMARFNRNNITIKDARNNTYISPELLAEKNPDCNVYIYELPAIPTEKLKESKNQYVVGSFTQLKGGREAIRFYPEVKVGAQGTSSMTYGISAYNLDTKFPEKWAMDEKAIPVDYFNTKVNVASCEGANNALNQEWYNRHQVYKTQKRLQQRDDGKVARDTMQFQNGVVFIKDTNKTVNSALATQNNVFKEIPGYVENPYPRMYSIGNMGNSKKNTEVFHGAGNQYECCVEVADNNTSGQRMIIIPGFYPENKTLNIAEHEISLVIPDDVFDKRGFVIPGKDWGKTIDPFLLDLGFSEEEAKVDNKTMWKNALIGEGLFEFRYCKEEDDFEASEKFATFDDYQWEISNRFLRLLRWFVKNNPSQATNQPLETVAKFDDYRILGVHETAYQNYPVDNEVLKGIVVPGGEFTTDSAEYRVAKMLRESEDYLILDSIIYHYIFIERHTMVDNVAKNTFWNTEDGIHWELTKNYDNDTADGVNNSGNLVFSYGTEIMDNGEDGRDIFNARPSAWLHFAHGLMPLRERMYQVLDNKKDANSWKADLYLRLFSDWQSVIPEICWIEDFNRKYFRPNNVYGDDSYLKRLANGKKTHQRKQFEVYQEQYMNSEYKTSAGEGSLIQWRSNQPETAKIPSGPNAGKYEIKAKVKMYADGYFTAAIASGAGEEAAINIHIRGKKGQEIPFSKVQETNFNDATCYVYSPTLYQEFTGIETLYPEYFTASAATKLRKVSLIPQTGNQKMMLQNSLSFGSNVEEVIIRDCIRAEFELDLTSCKRLKKLDTRGSIFTAYTIADGAPLAEFRIDSPTALVLSNLRYLKQQNKETGETAFSIANYGRLKKVEIDNIDHNDVSSKDIVNGAAQQLGEGSTLEYDLENVVWNFNENDGITDSNIPLLDTLLTKGRTINNKSKELSLTGIANISNAAYAGSNALDLYEKYGLKSENDSTYPKLTLSFQNDDGSKKLYSVTIKNGDGEVKWARQYANYNDISNSDLNESAYGAIDMSIVTQKKEENEWVYDFNNAWTYTIVSTKETDTIVGENVDFAYLDLSEIKNLFEENETLSDIVLEPQYTKRTRYYTISFYDKDSGTLIHQVTNAKYGDSFDSVKPILTPIKDDSELDLTKTYILKGYSAASSSSTVINERFWNVTGDASLYTIYEEVDVYSVDYSKYLTIENGTLVSPGLAQENGNTLYTGRKIVLPSTVTNIASNVFAGNSTLKKIFTIEGTRINTIGSGAFAGSSLEYFDFGHCEVNVIDDYAFYRCPFSADDYDKIMTLPRGLTKIRNNAFNGGGDSSEAFAGSSGMRIVIPSTVTTLEANAVSNMGKAFNVIVQIGYDDDLSQLDINNITLSDSWYGLIHSNGGYPDKDIRRLDFYTNKYNTTSTVNGNPVWYIMCGGKKEDEVIDISCSPGIN